MDEVTQRAVRDTLNEFYDGYGPQPRKEYIIPDSANSNLLRVTGCRAAFGFGAVEKLIEEHNVIPVKVQHSSQMHSWPHDEPGYQINFTTFDIGKTERTIEKTITELTVDLD